MNFINIRYSLLLNLKNIPGWRTKRKILVIECDDWGGIRIPSRETYEKLLKEGLPVTRSRYRFDNLECRQDLELLFDVLASVKDKNGHSAVMTPVINVANPDFSKIKDAGFLDYYYEKFTDTYERYYPGSDVFSLLKEGIYAGIFVPELHGREHITVQLWLNLLREGDENLITAFKNELVSIDIPGLPEPAREFRAEFYFTSDDQKTFLVNSIKDSIRLFREIFGFSPRVFVPSNNLFHPDFDAVVAAQGVRFLYTSHRMPYPVNGGEIKYRSFIPGQSGPGGITYYTRNCAFEPTDINYGGIELTMKQIEAAFRWGKPANISTHRANFTGAIEPANREKGLRELKKLLKAITSKWPDVEFMGSGDALEYMSCTNS